TPPRRRRFLPSIRGSWISSARTRSSRRFRRSPSTRRRCTRRSSSRRPGRCTGRPGRERGATRGTQLRRLANATSARASGPRSRCSTTSNARLRRCRRGEVERMNRRTFVRHALTGGATAAFSASSSFLFAAAARWPIGCFNRPWTTWGFDEALKAIKAAGYTTTGLLRRTGDEPFIGADATPEYIGRLKERLAASGLRANMGALRSRHDVPLAQSIQGVRRQIDHALELALESVLT